MIRISLQEQIPALRLLLVQLWFYAGPFCPFCLDDLFLCQECAEMKVSENAFSLCAGGSFCCLIIVPYRLCSFLSIQRAPDSLFSLTLRQTAPVLLFYSTFKRLFEEFGGRVLK